jgi:hypothetical protein
MPNVSILTLLAPSAQQNHDPFAISAEVDSVSGTEIDPVLENPGTDTLYVREIATRKPIQRNSYLLGSRTIQPFKPVTERAVALFCQIFA